MANSISKVVLTTEDVCNRYEWSITGLWRAQLKKENPFPLPDFDGRPNKWLSSTLEKWEEENRLFKRQKQIERIKQAAN